MARQDEDIVGRLEWLKVLCESSRDEDVIEDAITEILRLRAAAPIAEIPPFIFRDGQCYIEKCTFTYVEPGSLEWVMGQEDARRQFAQEATKPKTQADQLD